MSASTRRMYRRRRRTVLLALLLIVGLVAMISRCGGSDLDDEGTAAPAAAVRTGAGQAAADPTRGSPATGADATATAATPTASTPTATTGERAPATDRVGQPTATPTKRTLVTGNGFAYAVGAGPILGTAGTLRRFAVAVEKGRGVTTADFANAIDRTLGDPRSWIAGKQFRLQRVPPGPAAEFTVYLASASTSQQMCAEGGLDTGGYTSCRLAGRVIINLNRWQYAVPQYGAPLATYQAYAINHEVGHQLGHGHEACPGPGRPAPVMQQQTYGLQGCLPNAWPYVSGQRYVGGPVA